MIMKIQELDIKVLARICASGRMKHLLLWGGSCVLTTVVKNSHKDNMILATVDTPSVPEVRRSVSEDECISTSGLPWWS